MNKTEATEELIIMQDRLIALLENRGTWLKRFIRGYKEECKECRIEIIGLKAIIENFKSESA